MKRADNARERISSLPRYLVSAIGFGTAFAVFANIVLPAAGYAIICLSLAIRAVADQLSEEQAPRRRSALLGRNRRVDTVLLIWITIAAVSSVLLFPYFLEVADRLAAAIVAACVATMLAVAWRIASAPPLLLGDDVDAEQVVDRETRATRTGNACFLAVAAIAVFNGYTGPAAGLTPTAWHYATVVTLIVAFGLFAWKWFYARHLSQASLAR